MSASPCFTPAATLAAEIRRGERSAAGVVDAFLDRIDTVEDDLNALITLIPEEARERAAEIDRDVGRGEPVGPLCGVPIALKDIGGYKAGVRHTYGSLIFSDNVADRDATFVRRLEDAGAIVLGKTNVPEFGPKGTADNFLAGPVGNPFDPTRNAGGSSGGSAAAVASGMASVAHGSDGGGSLRIPASWSGVYTVKPTFRRVAAAEVPNAFGSHTSFLHHGPLARTVEDAALTLSVMAGPDGRDPFAAPEDGTDYVAATSRSVEGLEVAYTPDYGTFPVDDRVTGVVEDALPALERSGATVEAVDVDLGHDHATLTDAWLTFSGVGHAARAATLASDHGIDLTGDRREEITDELARMIGIGREVSAVEYVRLNQVRTDVLLAIEGLLDRYDLIASPTVACLPVPNADDGHTDGPSAMDGEPVDPQIGWCITYLINFTGHPAASVPAGFADGLPVGMQLVGRRWDEATVLAASAAMERGRPWHDAYPTG